MNAALENLEPKAIWKHFDELSAIPRESGNEAAVREFVLNYAKRLGLETVTDKVGNVIVRKPAVKGREKAPTTALQGHLDMVCEKNEGTPHDFLKDPIRMVRRDDWLHADGTTLGADNGVGVASAMAVMESKDIGHGPLEFIFTIDEERGLTGASEFGKGLLTATYLLNLDGEEKGTICIGCAGGINTTARTKIKLQPARAGAAFRVKVSGLKGGHSGVDINLGRGNALRIIGRLLQLALGHMPLEIADIKGGSARNVIPREATAIVLLDAACEQEVRAVVSKYESDVRTELGAFDPGLQITVESTARPAKVLDAADARRIVDALAAIHTGVIAMSPDVPGLVQTSTNLATIAINGEQVEIGSLQRSPLQSSKIMAADLVGTVCRLAGFEVESTGNYPGWKPEPSSELVRKAQDIHEKMFGKRPELVAMHAGLECGVIGEKYPGMQMISFGPQIESPHSPNERVQISSVETFWKYLKGLLEEL